MRIGAKRLHLSAMKISKGQENKKYRAFPFQRKSRPGSRLTHLILIVAEEDLTDGGPAFLAHLQEIDAFPILGNIYFVGKGA